LTINTLNYSFFETETKLRFEEAVNVFNSPWTLPIICLSELPFTYSAV